MASNKLPKGVDQRHRDADGEIRHKRGDTRVKTIRVEYGSNVLPGFSPAARLDTVLRKTGATTLHEVLKRQSGGEFVRFLRKSPLKGVAFGSKDKSGDLRRKR